jgi:hypothetical protein
MDKNPRKYESAGGLNWSLYFKIIAVQYVHKNPIPFFFISFRPTRECTPVSGPSNAPRVRRILRTGPTTTATRRSACGCNSRPPGPPAPASSLSRGSNTFSSTAREDRTPPAHTIRVNTIRVKSGD